MLHNPVDLLVMILCKFQSKPTPRLADKKFSWMCPLTGLICLYQWRSLLRLTPSRPDCSRCQFWFLPSLLYSAYYCTEIHLSWDTQDNVLYGVSCWLWVLVFFSPSEKVPYYKSNIKLLFIKSCNDLFAWKCTSPMPQTI